MAEITTLVSNITESFMPTVEKQLSKHGIVFDEYQKECAINCISAVNTLIQNAGLAWNSDKLDLSNIQDTIKKVALQKLNPIATNREVYFQFRSVNIGGTWKKAIEVGIEGDGNDAILRNFGVNVKKVHPFWEIREGDDFEYPSFCGITQTPPKWKSTGKGKVIRVVYPIELNDGTVEYRIAEREDVVKNLHAHINNNLMNETFNICADRYKATEPQKKQIEEEKKKVKEKISGMSLEELLDCADVQKWISPSWSEPQSRESMIVRKMRNNAIKKFPKDFGSAYAAQVYNELSDETIASTSREIAENANKGDFVEVNFTPVETCEDAPQQPITVKVDKSTGEVKDTPQNVQEAPQTKSPEKEKTAEKPKATTSKKEAAETENDDFLAALDGTEPTFFN